VGSRRATASRPLIGAAGLLGRGAAKQTVNEWLPTARPVPAKDDSAFAVEVIMIPRRGEGREAASKMATVSSRMLGKREGREIEF